MLGHPSARKGERMCKPRDRGLVSTRKDLPDTSMTGQEAKDEELGDRAERWTGELC